MTLSTLIEKGGLAKLATATPATLATQEADQSVTVAPVATVAVAASPEPPRELSAKEESSVRAWLAHIEERDPETIAEVLSKCHATTDARAYFLKRAEAVPDPVSINERVTCGECVHFERIDHPRLGHCVKGEPEAIAGLWDTDHRYCERYLPMPVQSDNDP